MSGHRYIFNNNNSNNNDEDDDNEDEDFEDDFEEDEEESYFIDIGPTLDMAITTAEKELFWWFRSSKYKQKKIKEYYQFFKEIQKD